MKALIHLYKYSKLKYLIKSFSLTHNTHTTIHVLKTSNQPTTLQKNEAPENLFPLDTPKIHP